MGQIRSSLGALGGNCPGSPLDVQTVYALARNAGFSPDIARSMVAIAQRESSLNPSCLATSVLGSTEASYGLWQINMSGSLGPQRLTLFGISNPNQLLDPATNAMAAYRLSSGGTNFSPWHIDSDTPQIPYRTRYLSFLASLPPAQQLESGYSGDMSGTSFNLNGDSITPGVNAPGVDATGNTTVSNLPSTNNPPIDDSGGAAALDTSTVVLLALGAGLLWIFFGR